MDGGGRWNVTEVRKRFSPFVQSCILSTPIAEVGQKDERKWRFDVKGRFSVKSAYLADIGFYETHECGSEPDRKSWSKMVWNVSIPPKARVSLWRAFNNLIPTAANLKAHHVPVSGICSLFGDRWASSEHSLLYCPKIVKVWKESRFWEVIKRADGLPLLDIATAIRGECGDDDYSLWATLVWQVWTCICRWLHAPAGEVEPASEASAIALLGAFQAAKPAMAMADGLGVSLGEKKWRKQCRGSVRVDVDAHFDPSGLLFGVGVVIRDHDGQLVAALSKPTRPSSNPMMAELMAVVHGIVFCVEKGFAAVELFTDSFLAARVMADPEDEVNLLPDDICDIMRVARDNFLIGISHMYRSANSVAHALAFRAASSASSLCWTVDFPSWLRELALEDIA